MRQLKNLYLEVMTCIHLSLQKKAKAAVKKRYILEQAASTREVMDELAALKGMSMIKKSLK